MLGRRASLLAIVSAVSCQPVAPPPATVSIERPAVSATAPTAARVESPAVMSTIAPPWSLDVADGNGNVYLCAHAVGGAPTFEYRPVRPEDSSSGVYSGGAPRKGTLGASEIEALWDQVAAAATNSAGHAERREKGTVMIAAEGPTTTRVILTAKAGAALLATLAALPHPANPR